jgi:signal transduction histidine kinase
MRMPEPHFEAVDLNQLVEDLLMFITPTIRWKGITLEVSKHQNLPLVLADPQQLQQVVMNLVTNALDVMPNGGQLTVSTGYLPSGAGNIRDPVATVRITDTGPGIPPDQMARLFTPYFTTKALGLGSGLGLVISRQILRSHGGDISAESEPGKGTSFHLILPCRQTAPVEEPEAATPATSRRGKLPQRGDVRLS